MNSYDIVADEVRKYWNEVSHHPCDVIEFFYQKYGFESDNDWLTRKTNRSLSGGDVYDS